MSPSNTKTINHILHYRTVWVLLCNIVCIPSYVAWMTLFLPVYLSSPLIYWQLEEVMFSWMLSIVSCWTWSAGYNILESGESLDHVNTVINQGGPRGE